MKVWSHIKVWLVFSIFSIFFTMGFSSPEKVYKSIQEDLAKLESVFGRDSTQNLVDKTNVIYSVFFSNVDTASTKMTVQQGESDALRFGTSLGHFSNAMIRSAKLEIYNIFLRLNIFLMWTPFVILFAGVAAFDGLMMRKVKIKSFAYMNPVMYNTFMHSAIFISGSMILFMHLPMNMSVWFFPLAGVCLGFCLMFGLMNLQRMSTA